MRWLPEICKGHSVLSTPILGGCYCLNTFWSKNTHLSYQLIPADKYLTVRVLCAMYSQIGTSH